MEPSAVLSAWAAGIAAGSALVDRWRVVGPGFARLALGVAVLLGVPAALAGGGSAAWLGCALAGVAVLASRARAVGAMCATASAAAFIAAGIAEGRPILVITAAAFLGGVSCEMLLGHWYLVDPRLPRSALRRLCVVAIGGAVVDLIATVSYGAVPWDVGDTVTGFGWVGLGATSVVLMVAVWLSLREHGYPAVMAATGLSYLAVLTTIGTVVLGRVLVTGQALG